MTNAVLKRSLVTSPRQAMEVIATQFGAILPEGNDAGLAVVIDNMVPLNVAPVGTDRRVSGRLSGGHSLALAIHCDLAGWG